MSKAALMWRWQDLPFLLICLASAGLCGWGAVAADGTAPKVVSAVTGLLFLGGLLTFYLMRWAFIRKVQYITSHGIKVILGERNRPTQDQVEAWTVETVKAILQHENWKEEDVAATLKKLWCTFSDEHKIELRWLSGGKWVTRYVRGYSQEAYFTVGATADWQDTASAWDYVHKLYRHELAHPILYYQDSKYYDEKTAHDRMAEICVI